VIRTDSPRSRTRRIGIAVVSTALLASGVTPLTAGGALAADLLAGPGLVGPVDAGPERKEVTLDWTVAVGAKSYVVQVGTDDQWSDDPTMELTTLASRITLPPALPHASYVWRVAAVGVDGQGRWSRNGTFTRGWPDKPRPLTPAAGAAAGIPTFTWTPVATASEYQLQVSTSPLFDTPFRSTARDKTEACFTTRTVITPFNGQANAKNDGAGDCVFTLLGTGETRYWRVRPLDHVVDGAKEVDTSPIVDEGINSQPPAKTPRSLDTSACGAKPPAASASPVASPTASASASPAPTGTPAASASPLASASPSPAAELTGGCEPAHTVEKGTWSTPIRFTSTFLPPAEGSFSALSAINAPTLSADVCNSVNLCRDFPTVSWPAVSGASSYRLYVALDASYDNIQAIIETPALQWTPTDQWRESTAGSAYFVIVQPCTTDGCGAVGQPTKFRKSSPALSPLAPAANAVLGAGEVVLTWQSASAGLSAAIKGPATSEAYAYNVQVATPGNPDFLKAGLVDEAIVDSTHHVSATKDYGNGAFLWRVQAIDASGHKQPWSSTRTFTRDSIAPTFTVTPAQDIAVTGAFRITFSEPVLGISPTSVTVAGIKTTLTAAPDRRIATLTPAARLLPGALSRVTVTAAVKDAAGNPVVTRTVGVRVNAVADDRSPAMALGGSWTRLTSTNAVARTYSRSVPTSKAWRAATVVLSGRGFEVKGCVGPANGIVEIWVDGRRHSIVDTYRGYSSCGVTFARTTFTNGAGVHRVEVRSVGAKSARSKGTAIGIDAIASIPA